MVQYVACEQCGDETKIRRQRIRRAEENGWNLFCGKECARAYRLEHRTIDKTCRLCERDVRQRKKEYCCRWCYETHKDLMLGPYPRFGFDFKWLLEDEEKEGGGGGQ